MGDLGMNVDNSQVIGQRKVILRARQEVTVPKIHKKMNIVHKILKRTMDIIRKHMWNNNIGAIDSGYFYCK